MKSKPTTQQLGFSVLSAIQNIVSSIRPLVLFSLSLIMVTNLSTDYAQWWQVELHLDPYIGQQLHMER